MSKSTTAKLCLLITMISALCSPAMAFAQTDTLPSLTRGEATDLLVKNFNLEENNQPFLKDCSRDLDTCLFTFATRTNFSEFRVKPLLLYPDVFPLHRYYKSIVLATKLDLVRGYFMEENSPFRPGQPITRVEALKIVMNASGMMNWKEKFELNNEPNTWLAFSFAGDKWWYGRYLAAALQNGVLTEVTGEDAEATISKNEFMDMMENANRIVAGGQTSSMADSYGQTDNIADTSGNAQAVY